MPERITDEDLELLDELGVDAARIAVHGRSLGSALAVQLAAARPVRCAVLTSPFESLAAVGRAHYPWLHVGLLLRNRFD